MQGLETLARPLKAELQSRGGLVLLDGLDEVPEAEGRREQILQAVADFADTFSRCRFLVTCRTYAYQHQRWRLPFFETASLAPLADGQVRRFVSRWYEHIAVLRHLARDDARGRAALLEAAIFGSERLRSLAERPLLLTLMASLHAWREGSLPERREELYADAVNLLLDFWERKRVVLGAAGEPVVQQPSLAEWLRVDRAGVRRLLNELAFRAHAEQPELVGTADVPEGDLVAGLLRISGNPDARPGRLVEYLCDRAGLLLPRGAKVYTFPHRTFQEYLAACHLTEADFPDEIAGLARADPQRWREVALLAGAKAARGASAIVWMFADSLCYRDPTAGDRGREDSHGAHLAGLLLAESADLGRVPERHRRKLDRVRAWQVDLLAGSELDAEGRAECGRSVARLGDPRPEVLKVEEMELCLVPAGAFKMGEEMAGELADVEVEHDYWMGRFPVTNAHFAAFVAAGAYHEERFWQEAKADGFWGEGALSHFNRKTSLRWRASGATEGPDDYGGAFSLPNHPVVGVSWYEARAFCRWLSELLLEDGRLAAGWEIRLPNEAEWEMAARGGLQVPARPRISPLRKVGSEAAEPRLVTNELPERRYPWGDEIDGEHANYHAAAIHTTSAAGGFPAGVSPYGCLEMSGNVWEWCQDEEKLTWTEELGRVLRGGGWGYAAEFLRAAIRSRLPASGRGSDFGFRVSAAPASLGS